MTKEEKNQKITSYKDLVVWKKSIDFVLNIYNITKQFPNTEIFGLTSQMRRAAVSIPANIAEGRYRGSKAEFHRFLLIAFGSGAELETYFVLIHQLSFISDKDYNIVSIQLNEIMRMLNKLIHSVEH